MSATFDAAAGKAARDAGRQQAASRKTALLVLARSVARQWALEHGKVTADDVQAELERQGFSAAALGGAAGSIFKGGAWEWAGEYVQSRRVKNHARLLFVWRLKGAGHVAAVRTGSAPDTGRDEHAGGAVCRAAPAAPG